MLHTLSRKPQKKASGSNCHPNQPGSIHSASPAPEEVWSSPVTGAVLDDQLQTNSCTGNQTHGHVAQTRVSLELRRYISFRRPSGNQLLYHIFMPEWRLSAGEQDLLISRLPADVPRVHRSSVSARGEEPELERGKSKHKRCNHTVFRVTPLKNLYAGSISSALQLKDQALE